MSSGNVPDRPGGPPDDDPLAELLKAMFGSAVTPGGTIPPELREMLSAIPGLPTDPASMQAMIGQLQRLMASSDEGPVNWQTALQVARQVAAQGGDPSVGDAQVRTVTEALRTADLWLDRVADLSSATARTHAWSRAEWVEQTLDTWKVIVEPIAVSVGDALSAAMAAQAPEEMRGALTEALPMMRSIGGTFFGMQLGHAIGALAREVVSGSDTGLPLLPGASAALLPANIAAFGEGLDIPLDEVRLYLALREAAFARLVSSVPWLRSHLLAAVTDYARGIRIDSEAIESALREIDPSDPEAMQQALSSGLFEPVRSPEQHAALERLETSLALIEGWVDEVVDAAARTTLPHAAALRETVRRRRAAGGPAEHTFASLVGLELRPRRLREAAAVWAALTQERGIGGRDELWRHPDLIPTAEAFDDPLGFARGGPGTAAGTALDDALAEILADADAQAASGSATGHGTRDDAPDDDAPDDDDAPAGR